jgi:hypothetical protein
MFMWQPSHKCLPGLIKFMSTWNLDNLFIRKLIIQKKRPINYFASQNFVNKHKAAYIVWIKMTLNTCSQKVNNLLVKRWGRVNFITSKFNLFKSFHHLNQGFHLVICFPLWSGHDAHGGVADYWVFEIMTPLCSVKTWSIKNIGKACALPFFLNIKGASGNLHIHV